MKRARDFGLVCGALPPGPLNAITDVPGVRVGHRTLVRGDVHTGFTALLPHDGDLFREKVPAAVEVINGFGKSCGLIQVEELGQLETPILLGNTFSVGTGFRGAGAPGTRGQSRHRRETGTVNPVVMECNDGFLSDIRALALSVEDAFAALDAAAPGPVTEGAVGAGTGMSAFGFKAGIGSASRLLTLDGATFTLGVLVLANFGRAGDLVLPDGRRPEGAEAAEIRLRPGCAGTRLRHHRAGHGHSAGEPATETHRPTLRGGAGTARRLLGQRVRGYRARLFHRHAHLPS